MVAKVTGCIPCEIRTKAKETVEHHAYNKSTIHQNADGNTPKDEIYTWFAFRFKKTTDRGRAEAREYYGGT
jgi:hypothetical protein